MSLTRVFLALTLLAQKLPFCLTCHIYTNNSHVSDRFDRRIGWSKTNISKCASIGRFKRKWRTL